jgi:hypothetical protein
MEKKLKTGEDRTPIEIVISSLKMVDCFSKINILRD